MSKLKNPKTDDSGLKDFEPDEGETGRRVLDTGNVSYTFKTYDPYGLVRISPSNGRLPKELEGQYTSPGTAEKAIEAYLASKKK